MAGGRRSVRRRIEMGGPARRGLRYLFFDEKVVGELLVKVFDGVAVDIMIDSADKNNFGSAEDHGDGKEAEEEQGDPNERIDQVEQDHAWDGQEEETQQLDDPEAKGSADAFAPLLFHHAGGTAESGQGPNVLIGNDRNDEEGGDAPGNADKA